MRERTGQALQLRSHDNGPKRRDVNPPLSSHVTRVALGDVFLSLCEAANSPISLGVYLRFKYREFKDLINFKLPIHDYREGDIHRFEADYLCASFLTKFPDFETDIDTRAVAIVKWFSAEEQCRLTNQRFRDYWSGTSPASCRVSSVLSYASRKISKILGSVENLDLSQSGFGPGADTATRSSFTTAYDKWSTPGTATPGILELSHAYLSETYASDQIEQARLVDHSKFAVVPKNAKTDRAIGVEPRWNIYVQKGIGEYMAKRLAMFGQDIRNQVRNQRAAQRALKDGLATIDLSSASDTIGKNLVLDLLPEDWFDVLAKARTSHTIVDGRKVVLEKFSAMGNGYTFPLETLIFFALSEGVVATGSGRLQDIEVYGDDIIIPSQDVDALTEVFTFCGFTLNSEKSYSSGLFFESCGSDYFCGKNVRPVYLKESITHVEGAFRLANQIVEFARRCDGYRGACARYLGAYRCVVAWIPRSLRLFGPYDLGGCIAAPFDVACPPRGGFDRGWQGYNIRVLTPIARKSFGSNGEAHLLDKLSKPNQNGDLVVRRGIRGWNLKTVYVLRFSDFTWFS
jgi:hypothetical protein